MALFDTISEKVKKLSPRSRKIWIFSLGLIVGAIVGISTYYASFAALATFAAVVGLTGPLAFMLPLLVIGVVGTFYTLGLLTFLEAAIFKIEASNRRFLMTLMISSLLIAGVGVGVFIAASTPAVFALLSPPGLTGPSAIALPLIFAGLITLALTAGVSYFLYRRSGMHNLTQPDLEPISDSSARQCSGSFLSSIFSIFSRARSHQPDEPDRPQPGAGGSGQEPPRGKGGV